MEGLWGVMTVVGPILLGAAILFAIFSNRNRTRAEKELSERSAKELRDRIDQEDSARDRMP